MEIDVKVVRYGVVTALAMLVVGCSSPSSEPINQGAANGADVQESAPPPALGAQELPVGALIEQPLLLGNGGAVSLTVKASLAGEISKVGVQIGNFGGASDGSVAVELCKGSQCASGMTSLVGSSDNAYLDIRLDNALPVQAEDSLMVKLSKVEGSHDVALWLYGSEADMTLPDLTSTRATPKLRLAYK